MYCKIQGSGGGVYANNGSSSHVADYLEKESLQADLKEQQPHQNPFFNHREENISRDKVVQDLDNNRRKLRNTDAKFFVITINPSQREIQGMGKTREEQKEKFKSFMTKDVVEQYAANFNKGFTRDDLKYYAVIHEKRGKKEGDQLHGHIVVSRRTEDGNKSVSPQTNHSNTQKGVVKGGFSRTDYFTKLEQSFDQKFDYNRTLDERFEYKNALKKADYKALEQAIENYQVQKGALLEQKQQDAKISKPQQQIVEQNKEQRGRGLSL